MNGNRQLLTTGVTALAPATWGTTYLAATEWLPPDRPLLAATVRALPAGLILLAFAPAVPRGIWLWRTLVLGTLNIGAFFYLLFVATFHLPGGIIAVIMSMQPMFVLISAAVVLKDKIRVTHVVACVLGSAGAMLLVFKGTVVLDAVGVVAALSGAICMAAGITLTKRWGRPDGVGLITFTGWQLVAGGLVLLPFLLSVEGLPASVTGINIIGFAYFISMGAVISYSIWFHGIARLPALSVAFLSLGSPIVATILGYVFLHQTLSVLQLVGILVIISAALLAQPHTINPGRRRARASRAGDDALSEPNPPTTVEGRRR
ncbi:EamA family transporter [Nocardia sp. NPDC051052]|uniref:EamA family transporter n=1 Tax=Nocardia sp. NPDC051052 TaxID=3364322 RepID=UPI003797D5EC